MLKFLLHGAAQSRTRYSAAHLHLIEESTLALRRAGTSILLQARHEALFGGSAATGAAARGTTPWSLPMRYFDGEVEHVDARSLVTARFLLEMRSSAGH